MNELQVLVAVVAVVVATVGAYFAGKKQGDDFTFDDALDTFHQATQLVETYAPAADQLLKTKQLPDNKAKLEYVLDLVTTWLPEIDTKQLRGIVEAWVAKNHAAQ